MGRRKSQLSPLQQKPDAFARIQAQIHHFTIDYLADLGNVSRQTILKYSKGKPVSKESNLEIKAVLKKAFRIEEEEKKAAEIAELKEMSELVGGDIFAVQTD